MRSCKSKDIFRYLIAEKLQLCFHTFWFLMVDVDCLQVLSVFLLTYRQGSNIMIINLDSTNEEADDLGWRR